MTKHSSSTIVLPSFLRKTMKAYALKAAIRECGCELNRIGRSRNWRLIADKYQLQDIIDFIEANDEQSWLWLAKHLKAQQETLTHDDLVFIAKQNTGITVNQLIAKTDCTAAQARRVIDELEFL
ncbi:ribosome recycling factor family protein [Thalassotalea euphylliae]|uniref:ribosome recycling factor family protein n=1 Tax=Thalassotalea euphylliae TaxID=1655234 RepID=UPI002163F478|nr:ribosome recycling factor family protein [Thalassotalea euphylliae]